MVIPEWASSDVSGYPVGQIVEYRDTIWRAVVSPVNTNHPTTNNTQWELVTETGDTTVDVEFTNGDLRVTVDGVVGTVGLPQFANLDSRITNEIQARTNADDDLRTLINGRVRSVNGITPDQNGNVEIETGGGSGGGGGGTDVRSRLERALSGLRDNRTVRRFAPQDDEGFYTTATYTIDNDNTATRTFVYNRGGDGELTQDYYRGSFIDTFTEGNENALIKDWTYEDAAAGFGGGFTDTGYYFGRITGDTSGVSFLAGEFIDPDGALGFTAGEFTLPDDIMFTAGEFSGDGITT